MTRSNLMHLRRNGSISGQPQPCVNIATLRYNMAGLRLVLVGLKNASKVHESGKSSIGAR